MERLQFLALERPHGLVEITAIFGDIFKYISPVQDSSLRIRPSFENDFIVPLPLHFPLRLAGSNNRYADNIRCHTLLRGHFDAIFREIESDGLAGKIHSLGGCYQFRFKRTRPELSTHAWGIAIDLNPETNVPGTDGDIDPAVVCIFAKYGFIWGGDWKRKDPMHFQFCTGY